MTIYLLNRAAAFIFVLLVLATGSANANLATDRLAQLEAKIIARTNMVRRQHSLGTLSYNALLRRAAIGHSEEMLRLDYFSHTSPTAGRADVSDRVFLTGSTEVEVGENLAFYEGYSLDAIAERVVQDWMNSPGHRANLLKRSYNVIGVGVVFNGRKCLATQVFASTHVALDAPATNLQKDRCVVRISGRVLDGSSEVALFNNNEAIERARVGQDGRFEVIVKLRANSGTHRLQVGIQEAARGGKASFAVYNIVPVNTNAVASR